MIYVTSWGALVVASDQVIAWIRYVLLIRRFVTSTTTNTTTAARCYCCRRFRGRSRRQKRGRERKRKTSKQHEAKNERTDGPMNGAQPDQEQKETRRLAKTYLFPARDRRRFMLLGTRELDILEEIMKDTRRTYKGRAQVSIRVRSIINALCGIQIHIRARSRRYWLRHS